MEVDQIHSKFSSSSNGYGEFDSTKLGEKMDEQHQDDEEGDNKRSTTNDGGVDLGGGMGRFYGWPSSRIVRVSRASGGKDRHSKVLTSKGLRDRRVRLSVNTAIQFYDLQDRLGYDQPSKAVEWLLTAAASAIEELPPMNTHFLNEKMSSASAAAGGYQMAFDSAEIEGNSGYLQQEAAAAVAKSSPGSSNSETSKGSGISISRSESRMKARERAKGRAAEKEKEKEKEKENDSSYVTSFTELLSGRNSSINGGHDGSGYFTAGGHIGLPATQSVPPQFNMAADNQHHHQQHHTELQPFSLSSENLRGTLQSNSASPPSLLPMFPPPPNFYGGATAPIDNHQSFLTGFDARLQLYYGGTSGQKEKDKN